MHKTRQSFVDVVLSLAIFFLVAISIGVLRSISQSIFPVYFIYILTGFAIYFMFSKFDFNILVVFYKHIYVFSIILLLLPLLIGEITRGAVRWIPLGAVAIQPSEIVRPFLVLFFAVYLNQGTLTFTRLIKSGLSLVLPVFLIIVQPSLGVAVLTTVAFLGVLLSSSINKKYIFTLGAFFIAIVPLLWFVMAPYQKVRILTFINPSTDPLGSGYNSIQSIISVGSGRVIGRGLGKGVQTQLAFLPEKHNDFILASVAEELGFVGTTLLVLSFFALLWRLTVFLEIAQNPIARSYVSGIFLVLFFQVFFNIGMNMGLFPITGIPLPLVSAGGSSFLATMTALGIANNTRRKSN
ncbi:rod shape-determining protein RodA [Candidatus Woesebacteria bacterium]|nr:MAG: rod shape-determining protein RodA [Candidatus Woesebacteria bacterium]